MPVTEVLQTERLRLPLWTAEDVARLRGTGRAADWHPDFPREDDRDAASVWREGDPWGPRSVVLAGRVVGSAGFFGPPQETADGVPEAEVLPLASALRSRKPPGRQNRSVSPRPMPEVVVLRRRHAR